MEPTAKTKWKNPYPYGTSSSDNANTSLLLNCTYIYVFHGFNSIVYLINHIWWGLINNLLISWNEQQTCTYIPVYTCSPFPSRKQLQRCPPVRKQSSANFETPNNETDISNCTDRGRDRTVSMRELNKQCTHRQGFQMCPYTGVFFLLVAVCLWLTICIYFFSVGKQNKTTI
jgi:hypothetical protein